MNLARKIYYSIIFSKSIDEYTKENYIESYNLLIKLSSVSPCDNIKYLLYRSYLALLVEEFNDSYDCINAFFALINEDYRLFEKKKYNDDEIKYMLKFAAYIKITFKESVNIFEYIDNDYIDYQNISKILIKIFPLKRLENGLSGEKKKEYNQKIRGF